MQFISAGSEPISRTFANIWRRWKMDADGYADFTG